MSMTPTSELFEAFLEEIDQLDQPALQYSLLHSLIRSQLQWAAFSAVEAAATVAGDVTETRLPEIAQHLLHPVDGALSPAIEYALIQLSLASVAQPLDDWLASRQLHDGTQASGAAIASRWTAYRNDRPGHGVVSQGDIESGVPMLRDWASLLLLACRFVLPYTSATGSVLEVIERGTQRTHVVPVPSLLTVEGHLTVVRQVRLRGDSWTVHGQELDVLVAKPFSYKVPSGGALVGLLSENVSRYRTRHLPGATSSTQVLLPQRQTDTFTGRRSELQHVVEWIADLDSRVCNVYGEGGIGKTTLVLEALHRLVDGELDREMPGFDVICFYSSKLTRYGPDGLERIGGITPSVADAAREVARCYFEQLGKDWFGREPTNLVDRAGQMLRELGIPRDRVLVVLDNTETLMTTVSDRDALAAAVDLMARKVGRILITSRNREKVEARPIALGALPESEAEQLLLRLAQEADAKPLQQTGPGGRRRIVRKFRGKPLLIEVFVRMVTQQRLSLARAEELVLQRAETDLGLFLYEDAWERFSELQRNVMLALVQIDTVINSTTIGYACAALGCSHPEMFEALEENRFAQIQDYGSQYDIVFDSIASAFLHGKLAGLDEASKRKIDQSVASVERRIRDVNAAGPLGGEQFIEAFSTDASRAAWLSTKKGDLEEARVWYEEAIALEPDNVVLLHRYAFFLTRHVGDLREAGRHAARATELDPANKDAWFVLGNVTSRQGDVIGTDRAATRATRAGFREQHRCLLLQARARVEALGRTRADRDTARQLEHEAKQFLDASRLQHVRSRLDEKHMEEVDKVSRQLDRIERD